MRLSDSLMNSEVSSYQQGVMTEGRSEESSDHWGNSDIPTKYPVEATTHVAEETTEEGQPTVTVKEEEEIEQILMSSPVGRRACS
jgi:hypothetical protein